MKETEARAGEALQRLLEKIPILQIEGIEAEGVCSDWEPDLNRQSSLSYRPTPECPSLSSGWQSRVGSGRMSIRFCTRNKTLCYFPCTFSQWL